MARSKNETRGRKPVDRKKLQNAYWRKQLHHRMELMKVGPQELAEMAGLPVASIYAALTRSEPGLTNFAKITRALGLGMDEAYSPEGTEEFPAGRRYCSLAVSPDRWEQLKKPREVHLPWPLPELLDLCIVAEGWGDFGQGDLLATHRSMAKQAMATWGGRLALVKGKDGSNHLGITQPASGSPVHVVLTRPMLRVVEVEPEWIAPVVSHIAKPLLGIGPED